MGTAAAVRQRKERQQQHALAAVTDAPPPPQQRALAVTEMQATDVQQEVGDRLPLPSSPSARHLCRCVTLFRSASTAIINRYAPDHAYMRAIGLRDHAALSAYSAPDELMRPSPFPCRCCTAGRFRSRQL